MVKEPRGANPARFPQRHGFFAPSGENVMG